MLRTPYGPARRPFLSRPPADAKQTQAATRALTLPLLFGKTCPTKEIGQVLELTNLIFGEHNVRIVSKHGSRIKGPLRAAETGWNKDASGYCRRHLTVWADPVEDLMGILMIHVEPHGRTFNPVR